MITCSRTGKPRHACCKGRPWATPGFNFRYWGEPLPQVVIDFAHEHDLDPHAVMDGVEDRGWESHDRGFDEQVRIEIEIMRGER